MYEFLINYLEAPHGLWCLSGSTARWPFNPVK